LNLARWREFVPGGGPNFPVTYQNVKTGLWLQVRNGGPVMYQTVTTGAAPSDWAQSC
jgi:hypothetical protein